MQLTNNSNVDNPGLIKMTHNPDSAYHYTLYPTEGVIDLFDFPDDEFVLEEEFEEDEIIEEDVEDENEEEKFMDYEFLEV